MEKIRICLFYLSFFHLSPVWSKYMMGSCGMWVLKTSTLRFAKLNGHFCLCRLTHS
jgi:hypothetical protein